MAIAVLVANSELGTRWGGSTAERAIFIFRSGPGRVVSLSYLERKLHSQPVSGALAPVLAAELGRALAPRPSP